MYRDNSLMPKEAVRLAALGTAAMNGPQHYADLAASVRHFTARVVGPSLDLMGTSIEMLRLEGLLEAVEGAGMADNALLAVTPAGREELATLLRANIRSPSSDPLNKLVVALKLRFLHLLEPGERREQAAVLADLYATELARLKDLRDASTGEPGHLADWLDHDIAQVADTLRWFEELSGRLG